MDQLPDPFAMSDEALKREWQFMICVTLEDASRTYALAAELQRRRLDY
jgi:hypothetical protein